MKANRGIRVGALVAALLLFPLQAAKACSCAPGDPRDQFEQADGAFVGTFIESHLAEPPDPDGGFSSGDDTIYSFRLDEEYKGELGAPGDIVEVHAAFSGASCGLEVQTGEEYGLFLGVREEDDVWTSNLCRQVSPETMREAASPLPAPTGEGPTRLLVGGSFGDAQIMGLDERGRTVSYGFGGSEVTHIDVCPGAERSVEISRVYPRPPHLVVRRLDTLDKVREIELPYGRRNEYPRQNPGGLDCRDQAGRRVMVFSSNLNEPRAKGLLLEIQGRNGRVLYEGSGRSATFGKRHAYIQQGPYGRDVIELSLRHGRSRAIARLPRRYSSPLALSPDGKRLAGIAVPAYEDSEEKPALFFTIVVRPPGRTRTVPLGEGEAFGYPGWMSSRRPVAFMVYPGPSKVFDLRLNTTSRFERWPGREPSFIGRRALAAGYDGALFGVRLPEGAVRHIRDLPSPVTLTSVTVPPS
jgi:hypothetical protein